jgi:2-polyprenyl-6-methoxyphenol hydroxylase-like FAD-dependent oxidoreductase
MKSDVLVVGAGPAGLATAIAAAAKGLRVTVADARRPPINKPCGEGLLPEAVEALRGIGIELNSSLGCPLKGFASQMIRIPLALRSSAEARSGCAVRCFTICW